MNDEKWAEALEARDQKIVELEVRLTYYQGLTTGLMRRLKDLGVNINLEGAATPKENAEASLVVPN